MKTINAQHEAFLLGSGIPSVVDRSSLLRIYPVVRVPGLGWGGTYSIISIVESESPVVLLSHIPLYRPDGAPCGPLRERGSIRRGVGHGYQNTVGKQTTEFLLNALQPMHIFRYFSLNSTSYSLLTLPKRR